MSASSTDGTGLQPYRIGIFCLEGEWSTDLRSRSSVRPLLEFLRCSDRLKLIYRDLASRTEFVTYVRRWSTPRYRDYPLGYFALHGAPGALRFEGEPVPLEALGEQIRGCCEGKVIYFGSCSLLKAASRTLQDFRRATGAQALCGYTQDAYWMPSAVFDMLFFHVFSCYGDVQETARCMGKACPGIKRHLGFRVID